MAPAGHLGVLWTFLCALYVHEGEKKNLAGKLTSDAQEMRHFPALSHNRHQGHLRKAIVCLRNILWYICGRILKYLCVLDPGCTLKPLSLSLYLLWTQFQIICAQSCTDTAKPGVKNKCFYFVNQKTTLQKKIKNSSMNHWSEIYNLWCCEVFVRKCSNVLTICITEVFLVSL